MYVLYVLFFIYMLFSDPIVSKKRITNSKIINEFDYKSNNNIIPIIKRKKINIFKNFNINDSQADSSIHITINIKIVEDKIL